MFERLHIDFAKHGWRATNQRDEFPQMIRWLSRQEKTTHFQRMLLSKQRNEQPPPILESSSNPSKRMPISIAKFPNRSNFPISHVEEYHKAPFFELHLKRYFNSLLEKPLSNQRLNSATLPISKINIYNMFHFHPVPLQDDDNEQDIVRALPVSKSNPHGRFDTVVVLENDTAESTGLEGKRP